MHLSHHLLSLLLATSTQADPITITFGTATGSAISTPTRFTDATTAGFEPVNISNLGFTPEACTSTAPFLFSFRVPEGNHLVTLSLGSPNEATHTTVRSELRRLSAGPLTTTPGQTITHTFAVNTRTPAIPGGAGVRLKDREREQSARNWDDKLTLEFAGPFTALKQITVSPAPDLPTVYLLGDSTVCDQPNEPYASWGQMLPAYFKPTVAVANHAESGETYAAALSRRRSEKIFSLLKPGDYLLIQFGHNDMKERGPGKGPYLNFTDAIKKHVAATREKGATPVLLTPVHRRTFANEDTITNSHGDYPDATRKAAAELGAPLIDLHAATATLYESYGRSGSAALFKPGDGSHHNNLGAYLIAGLVADAVRTTLPGLAAHLHPKTTLPTPKTFDLPPSPGPEGTKPDGD